LKLKLNLVKLKLNSIGKVEVKLGKVGVDLVTDEVVIALVLAIGSSIGTVSVFDKGCRLVWEAIVDVSEITITFFFRIFFVSINNIRNLYLWVWFSISFNLFICH
jgi:hypothetical protein